ncbi:HupE/UreJ family protein [Nitrosomonas communis]|uniref:HupE/UreJ family protein n=1 Tax=Nitrosomonas communis TaxID=44574 RepID=UPI0026EB0D16|nr:HupE/UreJ family protein [Nitrosomonas communis]
MNAPMVYFAIKFWLLFALAFFPLIYPSFAYAHTGMVDQSGWVHGFIHPLGGLDHILTMVAVGLWAAQMAGRAIWLVPFTFVTVMTLGGVVGMIGIPFVGTELGIVISLLVFGMLIAAAIHLPLLISIMVAGMFAFCHGYAHGAEMPHNVSGLAYAAGFILATACLHACGIALTVLSGRMGRVQWLRPAGIVVAFYGGSILFAG